MKYRSLIVASIALTLAGVSAAGDVAGTKTVKTDELNEPGRVIGRLAFPLGKVVTVEGEIVDGSTFRAKALDGVALLQVSMVNGQKVSEPCALQFEWFANAETKKLKGHVKLVGYETGQFVGVPSEAFDHVAPVAAEGFFFRTTFVVLKSL